MGPPVPITARVHTTPQILANLVYFPLHIPPMAREYSTTAIVWFAIAGRGWVSAAAAERHAGRSAGGASGRPR
eukprot:831712-Prorocentrum_minimum.AAC.1